MEILVICLAIITLILIRILLKKSFFLKGKIKKNRLICKCPPVFLWMLLLVECFWTFIFVLALMQGLEEGIGGGVQYFAGKTVEQLIAGHFLLL